MKSHFFLILIDLFPLILYNVVQSFIIDVKLYIVLFMFLNDDNINQTMRRLVKFGS